MNLSKKLDKKDYIWYSFNEINNTKFKFDKTTYSELKSIEDRKTLIAKLKLISKKIIVEKDIEINQFPNILLSCAADTTQNYCKATKLVVPNGYLHNILSILAADIQNPLKENILFSISFTNNIIDPFKFIRYPDENISLKFI